MRRLTGAVLGLLMILAAVPLNAQTRQLFRSRLLIVEQTRTTPDTICYVFRLSEGTTRTVGRGYCVTREAFRDAGWIPYPGPMPDLSVLDAPLPQPTPTPTPTPPAPEPTPTPPPSEPSGALYTTDFERGLTTNSAEFRWCRESDRIAVSTDRAHSGRQSLRFRFGPDRIGQDSWAECRFSFARAAEVWIEFMLWVPANYVHRADEPSNNKLFAIWGGGGDAYASSGRAKAVIELWRITGGDSRFRFMNNPGGSTTSSTLGNVSPAISASGPMRRGAWNRFRYHIKVGAGAGQGVIEAWVGEQRVYRNTAVDLYPNPATHPYFDTGYLLGWSNSGFADVTDFFIDDLTIWTKDPQWK